MREPVWQVFHGPQIWIPSNLISPVCLHWSFSCYPLWRVSFLPICAGQPAVTLLNASLTFLGVEPLQEQLKKSTFALNILLFSRFFSLLCFAMKTDIPWVPLQPPPASISACTSPGTADLPRDCSQVVSCQRSPNSRVNTATGLQHSPPEPEPRPQTAWGTVCRELGEGAACSTPLTRGCSQGLCTLLPSTLLTHVPQAGFPIPHCQ